MPSIEDKLMTASQIKEVTDTKLDKDFSSLDTSGGFSLTDELAVNISGSPYRITGRTLANAIGGGGTEQAALTNYVKNCGTISSLPATFTDSNITADMIVIEYTVGDESAVGSDWTVTTSDGSFTIAGTLAKSTSLSIVFGVGYSTTPSILTNLASDSPDNILKASPRPGVTGVLPLVNGGVGSSTAAGARTNLDVYSKSETNSAIQQSTATGGYRSNIPAGSDLNTYTTAGAYIVETDAIAGQIVNIPRYASGRLIVIYNGYTTSGSYLTQIYLPSTSTTIIYVRTKGSVNWTDWQHFAMDKYVVHSGTVTTSSAGTVSFADTYNTNEYACMSVFTTSMVSGYLLLPYKYGDAANGRWGFKAVMSGTMNAIASQSVSYVAIMYKYA